MTNIKRLLSTQKITVSPAGRSVSVERAGPIGPTGATGPSEASLVLVVDGQLLTRVGGVLVPITRANLALDSAFTSKYVDKSTLTTDGQLLTRSGGNPAAVTRASLAADSAFTSVYARRRMGSGAPGAVTFNGEEYYDTTAKRMYLCDGTGWIIMSEPDQTWTPNVEQGAATNVGKTIDVATYKRSNGWVSGEVRFVATGAGLSGSIIVSIPKTPALTTPTRSCGTGVVNGSGGQFTFQTLCYSYFAFIANHLSNATSAVGTHPSFLIGSGTTFQFDFNYRMSTPYL